jgi:hypothetical protein
MDNDLIDRSSGTFFKRVIKILGHRIPSCEIANRHGKRPRFYAVTKDIAASSIP